MQAGSRPNPALGRPRLVAFAYFPATIGQHYERTLSIGGMGPEHRVRWHLPGVGVAHDEGSLRRTSLLAIRGAAADVPMHKAALRHRAQLDDGQTDSLRLPRQAQVP